MDLHNARCLITGGSSGIGRALALALTRAGAAVAVCGRDVAALEEVAAMCRHLRIAEFPTDAARRPGGHAIAGDLAVAGGPERVADLARAALGQVDVLVCNAGAGWSGPMEAMAPVDADYLIDLNLRAPVHLLRSLLPSMTEQGRGHVVLISSIAGHLAIPGEALYSATKAALLALAESVRSEVATDGIGVSVISPGVVATPFFERRNLPYQRRFPRPVSAERVARVTTRAIEQDRDEVIVPGWLAVATRLHGGLPGLYCVLNRRFGPRLKASASVHEPS